jgi:hypothetical protein
MEADESARSPVVRNPFAYEVIPPIGRLLDVIIEHLRIGGCFRPGNRQLADWLGYASAGQMPYLLSELACKGWISYDRDSRLITLLRNYTSDLPIRSIDHFSDELASEDDALEAIDPMDQRSVEQIDSAPICRIDRDFDEQDTESEIDLSNRSILQCMESLVTTTESLQELVVVNEIKIPCRDETIDPIDRPTVLLLSELGATPGPGVLPRVLAAREWTPQQIRDRWEYDQERIKKSDGKLHIGIFWTALMAGQLAPARPDPDRPIDPASYADKPGFALGSDLAPPDEPESIGDHARRLLPQSASGADWIFVQTRLARGDSDDGALRALGARRSAVRP